MRQIALLVVLVLVTLLGVWALWMNTHPTDDSFPEQVNKPGIEDIGVVLEPNADQSQDTQVPPSVDGSRNKRIVHVPDTRQDPGRSDLDSDQEYIRSGSDKIESALNGYTEDALEFVKHEYNCSRSYRSEGHIRSIIESFAKKPITELSISDGMFGTIEFDSFEEWSAALWSRFDQCQFSDKQFVDDLRVRLKMLAENGNVNARYMYALWPPEVFFANPDHVFEWLEYEKLALKFTWQNINAGNSLGLLALGISYKGAGLFTAHQPQVGNAFVIAAKKCGLRNDEMDSILDTIQQNAVNWAWDVSEEMVKAFCN